LFNEFDKDGDGKVVASEIYTTMKVINPITMEKAHEMIKSVDANGNGAIDRDEF
jgi:Ca2+-binding EF-hand superfamily protein